MKNYESLSHTRYDCKYHVVFYPQIPTEENLRGDSAASTRSIGRAPLESGFVVLNRRPRTAPWRPISRIRRATATPAASRPAGSVE